MSKLTNSKTRVLKSANIHPVEMDPSRKRGKGSPSSPDAKRRCKKNGAEEEDDESSSEESSSDDCQVVEDALSTNVSSSCKKALAEQKLRLNREFDKRLTHALFRQEKTAQAEMTALRLDQQKLLATVNARTATQLKKQHKTDQACALKWQQKFRDLYEA